MAGKEIYHKMKDKVLSNGGLEDGDSCLFFLWPPFPFHVYYFFLFLLFLCYFWGNI